MCILCFHEKNISRFLCQDTQNDVKRPEKRFRKNIRMCVCVCVCVCVCARERAPVKQVPWIVWRFSCIFMSNLRFNWVLNFSKNVWGNTNFHKIWVIVLKRREISCLAGVRMCVRACVCARLSNFQTTIIHKRLEISSWNLVHQSSSQAPLIVTISMQIDAQSEIWQW